MPQHEQVAVALEKAFLACVPQKGKNQKKIGEKEWAQALEKFNAKAKSLRLEYRLGWFGRALTAYRFQRNLIAQGHPPDMVRQLVFSMVLNAFVG